MKTYKCHKTVKAFKILDIYKNGSAKGGWFIVSFDDGTEIRGVDVTDYWAEKNTDLNKGGYFVQYEDGYKSYSPAEPFEAGYTEVK